jgi:tRNA 2-selenouridine synthase
MVKEISVDEAMNTGVFFVDVRSEGEFTEATIPGAVNIPRLRDEERARIGKVYKEEGARRARDLGLELVSPRLPALIREFNEISRQGPLVVFCWRGGLRSKSVASILETMGIQAARLIGGYKAYRRYVNGYLSRPLPQKIVVLHGLTGVGKTEVLEHLARIGVSAVDLEGLAHNRGSVFGNIGMPPQPSQKDFEGRLAAELRRVEKSGYAVVECESRRIGRIILPQSLVNGMREGLQILLYCSVDHRVKRLVDIYTAGSDRNRESLVEAISSLEKRLGKAKVTELKDMLKENRFAEVAEDLLREYYDPLYRYPDSPADSYDLSVDSGNPQQAAEKIKEFLARSI